MPRWPALALTLLLAVPPAAAEVLFDYHFDEASGDVLKDASPHGADARLNPQPHGEASDASVTPEQTDQWYPILLPAGVQCKNIVPGSEQVLSEGDRPEALDRDRDYAIDYAGGRLKIIDGGRAQAGQPASVSFRFVNPGPARVKSDAPGGGAVALDGHDDYISLGRRVYARELAAAAVSVRVWIAADCPASAVIWSCGPRLRLGLHEGKLQLLHPLGGDGKLLAPAALPRGAWCSVTMRFDGQSVALHVDGKEVARQPAAGTLDLSPEFRLGGTLDPQFFKGRLDSVRAEGVRTAR